MVNDQGRIPNLGDAATQYLSKLPPQEREASQPEVYKFARWYGWEISFSRLAGPAVAGYTEQLSASDTDYDRKLVMIRAFLSYAKKAGWSRTNLAVHLKPKKGKIGAVVTPTHNRPEAAALTRQKYDELQQELEELKKKSLKLVRDIQIAAADKDFRENAPLQYAREERGHVEGRIKELEEILKVATIIDERKAPAARSEVGDSIILCDLSSGEELCYMIVDPREVDPSRGKISIASPLGKALLGKRDGQEVEITVPAGKLCYRIVRIKR